MSVYKYVGRTKSGLVKKGTIDALNKNAAVLKLREQGINPREVTESKSLLHKEIRIGGGVKNEDFVIYCRQFATLIRAGISIVDATNILARQSTDRLLKSTLDQVEDDVRSGIPFSQAVGKHPKVFPDLFINMMQAGEATGNIDNTLERLATTFEKQYNLRKKVKATMTYPVILLTMTIVVVIFLLAFVVPNFLQIFDDLEADLPLITVITVAISAWLQKFWWLVFVLIIGAVFAFRYWFQNNKEFHYWIHYVLLRMPIFGPLLQKSAIARLMRTLSSLFSSAVPILQALAISAKVSGNPVISQVVMQARSNLEVGGTLTEPLEKSWIFPPLVTSMTQIGETTGSLDYMLDKISDFYEVEVERNVDTLKALIEPLMILLLAGAVGLIVAAILIPMFSLYGQI